MVSAYAKATVDRDGLPVRPKLTLALKLQRRRTAKADIKAQGREAKQIVRQLRVLLRRSSLMRIFYFCRGDDPNKV